MHHRQFFWSAALALLVACGFQSEALARDLGGQHFSQFRSDGGFADHSFSGGDFSSRFGGGGLGGGDRSFGGGDRSFGGFSGFHGGGFGGFGGGFGGGRFGGFRRRSMCADLCA